MVFFAEKRFRNAYDVHECIITFILHIHVKTIQITLINSLRRKGVGAAYPHVPTEKSTRINHGAKELSSFIIVTKI